VFTNVDFAKATTSAAKNASAYYFAAITAGKNATAAVLVHPVRSDVR
jgi:hypothetical protein